MVASPRGRLSAQWTSAIVGVAVRCLELLVPTRAVIVRHRDAAADDGGLPMPTHMREMGGRTGPTEPRDAYDLVVVGTGFAGTFFLHRWLRHAAPSARALVLERGVRWDHARRVAERRNSPIEPLDAVRLAGAKPKPWRFTIGWGGGTNCWWGNTPRMVPDDFRMRSRFGVGRDWPISYSDLDPYYRDAEAMMSVSGPTDAPHRPGSYPQPPHRLNGIERALRAAHPGRFGPMPTARARVPVAGRGACCANGVCHLCPADAKFTIENSLPGPLADGRVRIVTGAEVRAVDMEGGRARGVQWREASGREHRARADTVVLAANALFNPAILLRSGFDHGPTGRRLHEQIGLRAEVMVGGIEGFDGSTSVTGLGTMLYDDPERRRTRAACLIETWNVGTMRREPGRWREVLPLRLVFEDLPLDQNRVELTDDDDRPVARFERHSDYAARAVTTARADLERVFASLPVERIDVRGEPEPTEGHIQGTVAMSRDPSDGVVDADGVHHAVRNLLVLGSSAFPTGAPANPSLTIAALALRAADRLVTHAPAARGGEA